MGVLPFLVLCGVAFLLWRAGEQLTDLVFRLSEIQRDLAEIRRELTKPATNESESDT